MFVANAGATAVVDVIIMLGTNDSAPTNWNGGANATQYQTDYAALINHFQSLSTHPVVFALEDGTTASPEGRAGSVGSSGSSGSSGESGSAEAGASGGGGGNTAESTGQPGGCTVGMEDNGSRAMPDGCLVAFALLILERRRRSGRPTSAALGN